MRKMKVWMIAAALAMAGMCLQGFSQTTEAPPPPPPNRFFFQYMGVGPVWKARTVTGAPYSAEAITETVRILADGNRIDRKETALVYRDSAGRTRRDRTLSMIGPWSSSGKPPEIIFIHDPVANVNYVLNPAKKIAYKRDLTSDTTSPPGGAGRVERRAMAKVGQVTQESLGVQMIAGVEADGTRTTTIIQAGKIGNERPITITSEAWYSPALQEYVLTKRDDPQFGEITYQLTNIKLGEPPASLFQVPSDYTVQEGPPPRRGFRIQLNTSGNK